jgi:hypothetical protein
VVILLEGVGDLGRLEVALGRFVCDSGDDQWGPRFIDEDGVNLVDHAKVEVPQYKLGGGLRQIVAEEVKSELRVGDIGDVGVVPFRFRV